MLKYAKFQCLGTRKGYGKDLSLTHFWKSDQMFRIFLEGLPFQHPVINVLILILAMKIRFYFNIKS